jgi:hypothetical protein
VGGTLANSRCFFASPLGSGDCFLEEIIAIILGIQKYRNGIFSSSQASSV